MIFNMIGNNVGVDAPIFTITRNSNWEITSITCDKTYAECDALYESGKIYALGLLKLPEIGDYYISLAEGSKSYVQGGGTILTWIEATNGQPYLDIMYKSDGTITWNEPSRYALTLNATANGTYTTWDGAYTTVNVSVPTGITPSGTMSITSNGIYDIVSFASVDVNVSGGGGGGFTADEIAMRTISGVVSGSATTIGDYAFAACSLITTATFPNATSVGSYAFATCRSLTTANLPNVTSIGTNGFAFCSKLTTASFPSATTVSISAFANCWELAEVYMPNLTTINQYAFYGARSLSKYTFSPELSKISASAFYNTRIKTADFPNVTSMLGSVFANCYSLTTASFPKVPSIGISTFANCSSLETVYFPSAATIGQGAFVGCKMLQTASFPMARSIATLAFSSCSRLMSLYLLSTSVASLANKAAFGYTPMSNSTYTGEFGSIYVPASLVDSYKSATNWSVYSARITAYVE